MRSRHVTLVAVALALLVIDSRSAAGTIISSEVLQQTLVVEKTRENSPPLDRESTAVQGATMYSETDVATNPGVVLLGSVPFKSYYAFRSGAVLKRFAFPEADRFCGVDTKRKLTCLFGDRRGTEMRHVQSQWKARVKTLKRPVRVVDFDIPLTTETISATGGTVVRLEILYQGAAAGVLRLLYREYSNDMVRPAFAQELTYDYDGEPITVSVKGAQIEVVEAGNAGIKYRVLSRFAA